MQTHIHGNVLQERKKKQKTVENTSDGHEAKDLALGLWCVYVLSSGPLIVVHFLCEDKNKHQKRALPRPSPASRRFFRTSGCSIIQLKQFFRIYPSD